MSAETSPAGEAGSGNGSDDNSSTECPTCGRDFDSVGGMRYHHATIHGESIATTTNKCENCGGSYEIDKCRSDSSRFCSYDCKNEYQKESQAKENNPNWEGGPETVSCDYCGGEYEVAAAYADESRFCSMECAHEWQSENWTGENHHMWSERETITCETCGEEFEVIPCRVGQKRFCSQECRADWHADFYSGENHPNYKHGTTPNYGPNWEEQAEKARERDNYECQICGAAQENFDHSLPVHHITPRRDFIDENGEYDYKQGNRLGNLIALCNSCHGKYGDWGVIPTR